MTAAPDAVTPSADAVKVPPLREDIQLWPGAATHDGRPTWILHDPAIQRFIRIGWMEFEILSRWPLGSCGAIAQAVSAETTMTIVAQDVFEVLRFAERANLLRPQGEWGLARLAAEQQSRQVSAAMWMLKNYLFLRIRLFNPDRLLEKMLALMGWMFTRQFIASMGVLALVGFYLIARQWEKFTHSFSYMFSPEGFLIVGVALSLAKIVHEFGHGLMAKRFGCRVPAMGVALLVLWPVLWTDVTDSWRLTSRRQRLAIDSAGMLAEILLAIVASLLWSLLPDGAWRTGVFMLASSTWLITLAINLNPLMRFDGYFLLSDLLDVPNLQDRAFALARWWLREQLFGLGDPPPERFPKDRFYPLLAYSYATWIYRFGLFLGIALLVYHFAFKLLGLFLMAVEIGWFIARPIAQELKLWGHRLPAHTWNRRNKRTAIGFIALLFFLVIPWHTKIEGPALLRAGREAVLYTATAGQLVRVIDEGAPVAQGDVILELNSPDILYRLETTRAHMAGLNAHFAGQAFDRDEADSLQSSWDEIQHAAADYAAVEADAQNQIVKSPFDGVITDVPIFIHPGLWMPAHETIGTLIDPSTQIVEAYINESDIARLHKGDDAVFFPENNAASIPLKIEDIGQATIGELSDPELASLNGGNIAVRKTENGKLIPDMALYKIKLVPTKKTPPILYKQRGSVKISGDRISILYRLYQRMIAIIVRESGL